MRPRQLLYALQDIITKHTDSRFAWSKETVTKEQVAAIAQEVSGLLDDVYDAASEHGVTA
jgi:hypothetical protein